MYSARKGATLTKTATLSLPKPHSAGQQEMLDHQGHGVAFCGRRYGKTEIAVIKLIIGAMTRPGLYWWVGLSWRSASMKRAWRLLKMFCTAAWRAVGESADKRIRESDKELTFPGGGVIWLRTAEKPDSLAGEGIMGVVLDEFSLMPEVVWTEYVAATLLDYGGWALFIGVPKGLNWASRLWMKAKTRSNWKAWQFTSYDNPTLDKAAIDEMAAGLPERLRKQEIFAEVIDDAGAVFRRVAELATATPQDAPIAGHVYSMGVDWGRVNDATVFTVIDATLKHAVYQDRMTGTDYETQVMRLKALHAKFRPSKTVGEANAMGGPLLERLQKDGVPITAFTTTNSTKQLIIDALTMAYEQEAIRTIADEELITELQVFETERLPSGLIRYGAPAGFHDDCVISLALAWHAANNRQTLPANIDLGGLTQISRWNQEAWHQ